MQLQRCSGQRLTAPCWPCQRYVQKGKRVPNTVVNLPAPRPRVSGGVRCSAFEASPGAFGTPYQEKHHFAQLRDRHYLKLVESGREAAVRFARFLVENERLLVVAASTMIMSLSHTALRPVLPVFAKGFGVGAAAVGTTISVYAIARLMMNVPAGILADTHGRKPLLVWGPAITALGMVGCGLAGSFQQLLVWRWVTGIGSALQMAGAQLFLADISLSSNRARTLGTNQAASLVGGLIGPALGGVLADAAGIRAPFTFTGAAAALAALYGLVRLPETRRTAQQADAGVVRNNAVPVTLNRTAAAQRVPEVVAAAAQSGITAETGNARLNDSTASTSNRVADAPRPASLKAHAPLPLKSRPAWRQLLCSSDFRAIALINAVMFATANGSRSVLMPLLAVQGFGMKTTLLGLVFAGMAVVSLVGVMPAAFVADHLGRKWTIVPSCLGLALALVLMAVTGRQGFLIAAAVYAISNACIGATPAAYAADVMPQNVSGLGLGIYRCAGDLGLMIGPALLGWISDITNVQQAMLANAAVLALAVAFFGLTAEEPPHIRSSQQSKQKLA